MVWGNRRIGCLRMELVVGNLKLSPILWIALIDFEKLGVVCAAQ